MRIPKETINTRLIAILERLGKESFLSLEAIGKGRDSQNLKVAWSDVDKLHKMGLALKVRGGVQSKFVGARNTIFDEVCRKNVSDKEAIANYAIKHFLLNADQPQQLCLFLDAGSTVMNFFKKLVGLEGIDNLNLRIVTNNVALLDFHCPNNITLHLCGGQCVIQDKCLISNPSFFSSYHARYCFLAASNISYEGGILGYNSPECEVKRSMILNSKEIIVLADSSKFKSSGGELIAKFDWVREEGKSALVVVVGEQKRPVTILTNHVSDEIKNQIIKDFQDEKKIQTMQDTERYILFADPSLTEDGAS